MKLKKIFTSALAVTLIGASLAACGSKGSDDASGSPSASSGASASASAGGNGKKELVMNYRADPPALDVSIAESAASFTFLGAISEGLYRLDKDMKPTPALAADMPTISPDHLTYTIKLRDGITWSDGTPVTANDFVYSFQRTLDPRTKATYAFVVAWIKGGEAIMKAEGDAAIEEAKKNLGAKAIDDKTLEITLDHPVPFFTSMLAFLNFYPQKKDFVEPLGDKNGADADKVIGAGPFKLTKWDHEQTLVLEKNEKYWDAANVKLDKVTVNIVKDTNTGLNLYETGATDYADIRGDQMDAYKDKPDLRIKSELVTGYVNFQTKKVPAFANAKVRQAFSMAIDREGLVNTAMRNGSVAATGYVPNGNSDGNGGEFRKVVGDLIPPFDAAKAKQLLEDGLKESGTTLPSKLTIIGDDTEINKKIMEFVTQQWQTNLGVTVEANPMPHKNRLEKELSKQYELVNTLWGADYNDPMTWLDMYVAGGPFNTQDWEGPKNEEYTKLVTAAQTETDLAKRSQMLQDAEKILIGEAAVAPLYFRSSPFVVNPKLKGLILPPYGQDFELKWAYFE
ncbi:peptide ABC transporter substrate-binding protein [Cohnella sp. CFH 77786]|uniref:peptide ABC transporter substrate-binding protein n=1 Tax=Cohnella sp. CFH 77786 TaxID=2662265 RepID=UPI001C60825E|nr:peptide ABC transporter substrate-binding protein [Cohnella sp. CFH 77786]MBW5447485.1 peptide ABC transporter substrate-binding protein [Cohnella sp. CFH 77786]